MNSSTAPLTASGLPGLSYQPIYVTQASYAHHCGLTGHSALTSHSIPYSRPSPGFPLGPGPTLEYNKQNRPQFNFRRLHPIDFSSSEAGRISHCHMGIHVSPRSTTCASSHPGDRTRRYRTEDERGNKGEMGEEEERLMDELGDKDRKDREDVRRLREAALTILQGNPYFSGRATY